MRLSQDQLDHLRFSGLKEQLLAAMRRGAEGFAALPDVEQQQFIDDALAEATQWGLATPQGHASYALALWFLDPGFPETSRYLEALLRSPAPEVRKVHAMNEWVSTLLGAPQDMAGADEALRRAFHATDAWGRGG